MKKPSRAPFYTIICGLILFGLVTAWLRHSQMEIPLLPGVQQPVWLIEARIDFEATGEPVTARLGLPDNPPGFRSVTEQAAAPGYGYSVVSENGVRRGEWSKRGAIGLQTIYYKSQFTIGHNDQALALLQQPEVRRVDWDGSSQETAAQQVLEVAWARSSTPQSLARELIKQLNSEALDQNAALLLSVSSDKSLLLEKLINQAGIPARPALGLYLEDARRHQNLTRLVQVFDGHQWVLFNPYTGEQGVPANLLLWHTGSESILDVAGGTRSRVSFSMIYQTVPVLDLIKAKNQNSIFTLVSIQHLPIEEQSMFKLLLLLPIGALVVVFMRIIIGLKTSGTFMPILIALAFLQTSLVLGLISFILVVAMGLVLRTYLSRLNLLLISRIATLVVLVIFIISALSLVGYQMGLNTGMTITFFPMIIIAWTIERMSILWEEEGPKEVLVQGGGSLLVAVLAYLLMQVPLIGHLTFNFPELNLIALALIMLMGQYTGYKLSELRRFRAMVDNAEADKKGDQP
ncbi:inactive transglutaminase family protein [Cellvibrio japonicus]|uniref:Gonadoliberin III-related protein n=1 Tax=Cellvibrio japonicus (strain Ueda107) TaxID=498211 RepID=B3PFE6_CELJU|nr:inactive transglutaminase family protein [Cellvibrio japonicus]ACE83511.1 Gonadoliberin III-related protein [Cellvibrio japonicus Ueda107]QEI10819.1 gonadoliberin III [Cellvibrio japonicus]QEI14395.1 gonadoliberin III [Cellvibrio japonicus]QEI17973.1 gonadoliberin III [Cellvibrio japonicus]